MALLRESSKASGVDVDVEAALSDPDSDGGVPHGRLLKQFARASTLGSEVEDARALLASAAGPEAVRQAALTVAAFSGLVRVADATGIALDDTTFAATTTERAALGVDGYAGAANTSARPIDVPDAFENAYELFR